MDWKYENGRIFCVDKNNKLMAETTYYLKEIKEVNIDHTYVNPILRGQGIAGKMMEVVTAYFRKNGLKVTSTCSYAITWLKKNEEAYSDIISKDIAGEAIACKIDGRH